MLINRVLISPFQASRNASKRSIATPSFRGTFPRHLVIKFERQCRSGKKHGTRAPHISSLLAVVKTDYAIESGGERRWIEMREILEWSTVGSGRGGWNGMDIPPWNGFIVPDAGFIPAMVVQIHQQLDLLGRWINLSIHGRRSTDGASTGG